MPKIIRWPASYTKFRSDSKTMQVCNTNPFTLPKTALKHRDLGKLIVHKSATAKNVLCAFEIIFLAFDLFLKIVYHLRWIDLEKTAARYHSEANNRNKLNDKIGQYLWSRAHALTIPNRNFGNVFKYSVYFHMKCMFSKENYIEGYSSECFGSNRCFLF